MRWHVDASSGNLSWPLAKLVLDSRRIELGPRRPWARALIGVSIPRLVAAYMEIRKVERVRGSLTGSPGVRLYTGKTERAVVFWTFQPDQVLDAFEERAVEVDRHKHRVSLLGV